VGLVDAGHRARVDVDVARAEDLLTAPGADEPAALLRLRALLRHRALDVDRVERQAACGARHSREVGDLRDARGGEAELARGAEVVAGELRPRLAEVAQAEASRPVLLLELLPFLLGELRKPVAVAGEADGARDGHVGADAGERLQHLRLRLVEPLGERSNRDDEPDAEREPERREDGAAAASPQLTEGVRDVEHAVIELRARESGLRRR
jgi:hypothetical protein